jgi:hypothetical protein
MDDLDNGAATAAPAETVATETPQTPPETQQTEQAQPSLHEALGKIYDNAHIPRGEDGKFASRNPHPEGVETATDQPKTEIQEGKPEGQAVEMAKAPSIDAPNSLPSELKAQWASVPPAMQEHIAKREAESHRAITQMGQQLKAYEPFAKLVESNRDVFQNHRRNVAPEAGISQLLEAQRQLDRDPVASIAHIARVYGVDLSAFANQNGDPSNQSPHLASLNAQLNDLMQRNAQLERLVLSREEREAQAQQQSLTAIIEDFVKENPLDDSLIPGVVAHIEALKITSPHLSQKEMIKQAYEQARWSDPTIRQQLIAKERQAEEAKRAKEQAELAAKAKSAGKLNVRSSPGDVKPVRTLREILSETYDNAQRA